MFRTVYFRIDEWCAKDIAERGINDRKLPSAFRAIYDYDFFLCYDTADFDQAKDLKEILTRLGFEVWWPSDDHNAEMDAGLSAVTLKAQLAKSRIAAVLVGSRDRGRWGMPEFDDALLKHCRQRKPLILFLLPNAYGLEANLNNWLGKRYASLVSDPLYVKWSDVMDLFSELSRPLFLTGDRNVKPLGRILREVVKLLHLPGS